MIDYGKVPWRAVQEYLLSIESAPTMNEFFSRAVSAIDRLIPSDVGVGLQDLSSGKVLSGNGYGFSESNCLAWDEYYRFRIPFAQNFSKEAALSLVSDNHCALFKWSDYRDSEFVTDFVGPGEACNLVCVMPGLHIMMSFHRSPWVSVFSEAHCAALAVLSPHVSNLYSCFRKLGQAAPFTVSQEQVMERFPRISKREAEVAILLCYGLTASEIASKLFISVRTVQTHLDHLYLKLDVRRKREAISLLTGNTEHNTRDPARELDL
jgi:DNA-binding CsgD family transcriptional regulator